MRFKPIPSYPSALMLEIEIGPVPIVERQVAVGLVVLRFFLIWLRLLPVFDRHPRPVRELDNKVTRPTLGLNRLRCRIAVRRALGRIEECHGCSPLSITSRRHIQTCHHALARRHALARSTDRCFIRLQFIGIGSQPAILGGIRQTSKRACSNLFLCLILQIIAYILKIDLSSGRNLEKIFSRVLANLY